MTNPQQHMMMMPDSAYRQWRGAARDLANAEERLLQARSIWLQNMLADFELRRHAADEAGQDVRNHKVLFSLGVPCVDCKSIAGPNSGHAITFGGTGQPWPVWAECGKASIDPTKTDMPTPPAKKTR